MDARRFVGVKRRSRWEYLRLWAATRSGARRDAPLFASVGAYCMFLGYPRSGHSLVGALVDAHRHAVVAHELDALAFVEHRYGRDRLFHLILENAREFAAAGRTWTGYSYDVPGQWQGRFEELRVLGDKKGGRSVRRLATDPGLLRRLRETVGVPLRFLHVVRNPYDMIATRGRRQPDHSLEALTDRTFALVRRVARLREQLGDEVLDVHHEALSADARGELRRICAFLGLDAPQDYLDAASALVRPQPNRSRFEARWPAGLVERIASRSARFDFLADYSFEG